jgi:hypothetical protein
MATPTAATTAHTPSTPQLKSEKGVVKAKIEDISAADDPVSTHQLKREKGVVKAKVEYLADAEDPVSTHQLNREKGVVRAQVEDIATAEDPVLPDAYHARAEKKSALRPNHHPRGRHPSHRRQSSHRIRLNKKGSKSEKARRGRRAGSRIEASRGRRHFKRKTNHLRGGGDGGRGRKRAHIKDG